MFINYGLGQIDLKIVYYGPGFSGKTTNLEWVHAHLDPKIKGNLLNLKTKEDRTIFFDFMQLEVGAIHGLVPKFSLYTVPGQDMYATSRRIILNGVDGIVYVADSDNRRMRDNLFTLVDMVKNLRENKHQVEQFPIVLQYNKRDLPEAMPVAALRASLNRFKAPDFEACAAQGQGVFETLRKVMELIVHRVQKTISL